MTAQNRTILKSYFQTGDKPDQSQFSDLIDSSLNLVETAAQTIVSDVAVLGELNITGGFSANTINASNANISTKISAQSANIVTILSAQNAVIAGTVSAVTLNASTSLRGPVFRAVTSGAANAPSFSLSNGNGFYSDGTSTVVAANNSEIGRLTATGSLLLNTTNASPFTGLAAGYLVADLGTNANHNGVEIVSGTTSYIPLVLGFNNSITGNLAYFVYNNNNVGTISTNGTNTAYNTSSDQRLKKDIQELDASSIIDNLRPVSYKWISTDQSSSGFLAQELYEVVPEAVLVGGDDPQTQPWAVDYSKLVPYLAAEIKSLRARVRALEE